MSCDSYPELDITSLEYLKYYTPPNSSSSPYTTVLPDVSNFSFTDSEIESEDSDSSSVFDENNLAMKVKILETKLNLIFLHRKREREEMLHLHQAMTKLVTDLVQVVSPPTSLLVSPPLRCSCLLILLSNQQLQQQ